MGLSPLILYVLSLNTSTIIPVCSEYNHVRTWGVTRFRGMISTQPGPTSLSSFNVVTLEQNNLHSSYSSGNKIGRCSYYY